MNTSSRTFTVSRDPDGVITVVAPFDGDLSSALVSRLAVSGGTVWAEVNDPNLWVSARIDDWGLASWWVERLFGAEIADAVAALADAEPSTDDLSSVRAEGPGELAPTAGRLLLGAWLWRWWPASSSEELPRLIDWLVDAEVGENAWMAEELFGGVDLARTFLSREDVVTHLTETLQAIDARHVLDVAADPVAAAVVAAARASVDALWLETPGYDELETAYERVRARVAQPAESKVARAKDAIMAWTSSLGDPRTASSRQALTAGPFENVVAGGEVLVDWRAVHPRSVDVGDRAATWQIIEDDGGWQIEVTVGVVNRLADAETLFARVATPRETIQLPLGPFPHGTAYGGTTRLQARFDPSRDEVVVDLGSDRFAGSSGVTDPEEAVRFRTAIVAGLESRIDAVRDGRGLQPAAAPFAFELQALYGPTAG